MNLYECVIFRVDNYVLNITIRMRISTRHGGQRQMLPDETVPDASA